MASDTRRPRRSRRRRDPGVRTPDGVVEVAPAPVTDDPIAEPRPQPDRDVVLDTPFDQPLERIPDDLVWGVDHREQFDALRDTHPLLLLPVRLETRFEGTDLKIRLYPDQIHLDAHDPRLTDDELAYAKRFWRHRHKATTADALRKGEQWLVSHISPRRAAWVARRMAPKVGTEGRLKFPQRNTRDDAELARAGALPERWAVIGTVGEDELFVKFGARIPDDLGMSAQLQEAAPWSTDDGALPLADGVGWMIDYPEAVRVGMGITVTLSSDDLDAVKRDGLTLIAVGVRDETPNDGRKTLEGLLQGHLYTDGLEVVPQGTATNNTDATHAGWTEGIDDVTGFLARELAEETPELGTGANATRLSTALGLREALLARVLHGDGTEHDTMAAMNRALWPVTWGRYFDDLLAPAPESNEREADQVSVIPADAIDATRALFVDHVRGGATLPALAIGPQPYGVLPVRRTREGLGSRDAFDNLEWVLLDLKAQWRASVAQVPRLDPVLGDAIGSDPLDDTVTILGSLPHPGRFVVRQLDYARDFLEIVPDYLFGGGIVQEDNAYYSWIYYFLDELPDVRDNGDLADLVARWGDEISSRITDASKRSAAEAWQGLMAALINGHDARQDPIVRLADRYVHGAYVQDFMLSQYPPTMDDPKLFWSFFNGFVDERSWNRALVQSPDAVAGGLASEYLDSIADRVGSSYGISRVDGVLGGLSPTDVLSPVTGPTRTRTRSRSRIRSREVAPLDTPLAVLDPDLRPDLETPEAARHGGLSDDFLADQPLLYQLLDSLSLPDDIPQAQRTATHRALDLLAGLAEDDIDGLELRFRETLGLTSHRLDAWFTALAQRQLDTLRAPPEGRDAPRRGIQLGGFGWVQDLKPKADGSRVSQGFIHAPSVGHAATAAVLRAGFNAHGSPDPDSLIAVDLRSDRMRLASWLLDGVRQGQSLGELLGCRFERMCHDGGHQARIDECRRGVLEHEGIARDPTGPVDGLALAALFEDPGVAVFDGAVTLRAGSTPTDPDHRAVWDLLDAIGRALDAVADAGIADSVHHLLQGNRSRASATLEAITTGAVAPPELMSLATPRPGAGVTQRLLITLGAGETDSDWGSGPRAVLEPALDSWVAQALGPPDRVVCAVSFTAIDDEPVPDPLTVHMGQLKLSALDAVFDVPPADPDVDTSWGRRVVAAVLDRPEFSALDGRVVVDFDGEPDSDQVSFREFAQLSRSLRTLLGGARSLDARDLDLPGATDVTGIRLGELETRVGKLATKFGNRVDALETALPTATDDDPAPVGTLDLATLRQHMGRLAGFGLARTDPSAGWTEAGRATLYDDAWSLAGRGRARLDALTTLQTGWADADALADPTPEARLARARATSATLLGKGFPLLPRVRVADGPASAAAFDASDTLLGGVPAQATAWLRKLAHVRADVARLDDVITLSELIRDGAHLHPTIGQLPDQDVWVSTAAPADRTQGYLGLCTLDHGGLDALRADKALAGLVLDSWVERIPADQVTTGVALNFDAPSSRAPQSLLLMVPPRDESWSFQLVVDTLMETLEAARLRAVDPDILDSYGHQFPAIYPPGRLSAGPQE